MCLFWSFCRDAVSRLLVKAYSNCNCCSTLSTNRLSTQFRDNVDSVVYVSDSSSECYSRQYDGRRTTQKRNQHTPPEKETQYLYDVRIKACIKRYDRGSYSYSKLQFLREFSHSLGMHTESFHVTSDVSDDDNAPQQQDPQQDVTTPSIETSAIPTRRRNLRTESTDCCEVCLISPRTGVALCAVQPFSILWKLRRCCCCDGQRLSTVPYTHNHGSSSVWLDCHFVRTYWQERSLVLTF